MNKIAAVMLVIKDGLILSVSRRNDIKRFGICGGKKNDNESIEDCAKRECAEETGINVKTCIEVFKRTVPAKVPNGHTFEVHCFYASDWDGEPKNKEDGIEVRWLTEHQLITTPNNGGLGAFPEYNFIAINSFKQYYPDIKLFEAKKEYLCKNCKRPVKEGSGQFCEDLSDKCIKEWNVRQRIPKMPILR